MSDDGEIGGREPCHVLALLPVLNEVATVSQVIRATLATGVVDRILVVDDESQDGTSEALATLRQELPQLDVVVRKERGLGTALLTGFEIALQEYDFDRLVTLDADFSHDPSRIPELLAVEADLVLGSRYADGGGIQDWPLRRRAISFGANSLARHLLGLHARDVTTGFRAYRRSLVASIAREAACGGYEFQLEAVWLAEKHGGQVAERPICFVERRAGRSKLATIEEALRFSRFVLVKTSRRLLDGLAQQG